MGIGLKSLTENIDTGTSGGRLVFHIFGALAEFERSIIRECTFAGLTAAKARGRVGGRPKVLTDDDIAAAKALLKEPDITAKEVAERLKGTTHIALELWFLIELDTSKNLRPEC